MDVRLRLQVILGKLKGTTSPALLRALRAVQVLELAGTREAETLLRALSGGAAEARLTRESRAALERLTRRARHEEQGPDRP